MWIMTKDTPVAAICLIGDELLSGRTQDTNTQTIARFLAPFGIPLGEVRMVPDDHSRIIEAVNALRHRYDYVFTTGGIGPTHDDITADAIAAAFEVGISENADALRLLEDRYRDADVAFTPARRRMARIPHSADLIQNPVSGAPGFQIGNVLTLAGVPKIVEGMLSDVGHRLQGGHVVLSVTVKAGGLREGDLAERLGLLAEAYADLTLGSYPWFRSAEDHGVALVVRGTDHTRLTDAASDLEGLVEDFGGVPTRMEGDSRFGD
jgi:molybdenum cofactor synthesis domain-containing protein